MFVVFQKVQEFKKCKKYTFFACVVITIDIYFLIKQKNTINIKYSQLYMNIKVQV